MTTPNNALRAAIDKIRQSFLPPHVELDQIMALVEKELAKTEKAYGGCHKCYGKGYATTADGIIGYDDFGGEGFKSTITTKMKFCTCDRGKQLAELLAHIPFK